MKHRVSIVVPVYNVERYISECIKSILRQTFSDFELILVDDGSKDKSGKICDEYATRDNRIRIIHQVNGGVSRARAVGVNAAQGEWVSFVDADDTIPIRSIETLMSGVDDITDIVVAKCDERKIPSAMTIEEYRRCCFSWKVLHSGPIARFYRKSLFNDRTFDIPRDIVKGEDLIMNLRLSFSTDKDPVLIDKKVYNYRVNESSLMHTFREPLWHVELFQKYLVDSVPADKRLAFQKDILQSKMNSLVNCATDNVGDRSYIQSEFFHELIREMRFQNMHFSFDQKLQLAAKTPFQLRMVYRFLHLIEIFCGK